MKKYKIILSFLIFILILNLIFYTIDKILTPTIITVADAEVRARSIQTINKVILDKYSKEFDYDDIIKVDKDSEGNIVLLKADTLKLNKIACDVSVDSQNKLTEIGDVGIRIPFGYIFKNNFLSDLGPNLKVKMMPIGSIETKYISQFDGEGINQTRHIIYVSFKTKMRIILPAKSNEIEINIIVPISETIIVGKTPNTSIQLDLDSAGYKLEHVNNKK